MAHGKRRVWQKALMDLCTSLVLLLWVGGFATAFALENRELSLQAPLGGIPVQADQTQRLRVAVVDFFAPPLAPEMRAGWLQWIEHEFSFRKDFEGLFDVVGRAEMNETLAKVDGAKGRNFAPLDIPALKTVSSVDWFVFLDLSLQGREWLLRARIYNGRSGAFFDSVRFPYLFGNLSLTSERLLMGLRAKLRLEKKPYDPLKITSSESGLLPESLAQMDGILTACAKGHCLEKLATLETLADHNPEFFAELVKNPLIFTAAYKEADDPLRTARLNLLENNPHEAALKLNKEPLGKGAGSPAERLYWLGRAYLAKDQPQDAKETFERLLTYDPRNRYARYTLARLTCKKGDPKEGLARYAQLVGEASAADDAPNLVAGYVECLRAQKPAQSDEALAAAMTLLADSYARIGDTRHADSLRIELLDLRFNRAVLEAIDLAALEELERRNLASMMDRRTIQHDENEALILWKLAALRWLEQHSDEAVTLLDASLKLAPNTKAALELGAWESLERGADPVSAQRYFERIPEEQRGPYLTTRIAEAAKRDEQALALWRQTKWPPSMAFESLRHIALIEARAKDWPALRRSIPALDAIWRGAEDILEIEAQTTELYSDERTRQKLQTDLRLLSGMSLTGNPEHLFVDDYVSLIKALPLVGFSKKGEASPFGKVAILTSDPLSQETYLTQFTPYIKRTPERIINELRSVLATRYSVVDVSTNERLFRERLMQNSAGQSYKPSKVELVTLASSLGVDTLIFISTSEESKLEEETLRLGVQLTLYDAVNQNIFVSSSSRVVPFFDWYRFNRLLVVIPAVLLLIIGVVGWRFHIATAYWSNPLLRAKRLAKQHQYRKAAELLERNGYVSDSLAIMGHYYVRQQSYALALEAFCRAHDYDNAVLALKGCPENDATYTQAADLFFQMKDYDRAEFYFRKLRSLPGMAKVAEARRDTGKAARIMGQYFFEAGNIQGAVTEYLKINDYNRAGMALFYVGEYRDAAAQFKNANNEKMYQKCLLRLNPDGALET